MGETLDVAENFFQNEEKDEKKSSKPKRKAPCDGRVPWTQEEEEELSVLFREHLKVGRLPSPEKISMAIKYSKQSSGVIHKRSLSSVKNKVIRMLRKK